MQSIDTPIQQAEAGWFTRLELQAYLGVGKNALPRSRIALASLISRGASTSGTSGVGSCISSPVYDHGAHLLRIPLRDIHWVAAQLVTASSTIRNEIARGVFPFGSGVQLGALDADGGPRLRRWCVPVRCSVRVGPGVPVDATPTEVWKVGEADAGEIALQVRSADLAVI